MNDLPDAKYTTPDPAPSPDGEGRKKEAMSGQAVVLGKKKMVFVSSETPDEVVKRAQVVIVSDGRWHLIGPAPFRAHGLGAAIPLPKVTCPVVDVSRVRDDLRMKQVMTVKSVTANVAKKVVTVSFSFPMTDETMPVADALGFLANKMPVTVTVSQSQTMFEMPTTEKEKGDE